MNHALPGQLPALPRTLPAALPFAARTVRSIAQQIRVRPTKDAGSAATVTVVIPCYNYERFLPMAIESALSQEGVTVDVVVVDDASKDGSLQTARRLAAGDGRITVVAHEVNAGPVQTFNDGLARARGEFLVRLDADDMLTPGSLSRAVAVMRRYPTVGLVYGHPLHFSGDTPPEARRKATYWTVWPGRRWLADRCRSGFNVITSPEVLMRRSVVDRLGGQAPLAHTHDMEMWLRLSAFSDVAYVHGADQAWHRDHSQSLSAREVDTLRDLLERRDAFVTLFDGPAGEIPEAARLRSDAFVALAGNAVELACRLYDHPGTSLARVRAFCDVATQLVDDVRLIPGWGGLLRRIEVGPGAAARRPVFFLQRLVRVLRHASRRRRWHRLGVW